MSRIKQAALNKKAKKEKSKYKQHGTQVVRRVSRHHPKCPNDIIELLHSFSDCIRPDGEGKVKYYKLTHKGVEYKYDVCYDGDFSLFIQDGIATAAAVHVRGYSVYGSYEFDGKLDFTKIDTSLTEERLFQRSLVEELNNYTVEELNAIMTVLCEIRAKMHSGEPVLEK